jgi:hypothetical protein
MNCKVKVKAEDGTFKPCSFNAKIMGMCINHYTMVVYGRKIYHSKEREVAEV